MSDDDMTYVYIIYMPGTSGTLSPFTKDIDGFYFNSDMEPDNFIVDFRKSVDTVLKEEGRESIVVDFKDPQDYYKTLYNLHQFTANNISVKCTSRMDKYDIILEKEDEEDTTD